LDAWQPLFQKRSLFFILMLYMPNELREGFFEDGMNWRWNDASLDNGARWMRKCTNDGFTMMICCLHPIRVGRRHCRDHSGYLAKEEFMGIQKAAAGGAGSG
jgi:hypothetical protein